MIAQRLHHETRQLVSRYFSQIPSIVLTIACSFRCRTRLFTPARGGRQSGATWYDPVFLGEVSTGGRSERLNRSWHL
jgi:hypothetical protein